MTRHDRCATCKTRADDARPSYARCVGCFEMLPAPSRVARPQPVLQRRETPSLLRSRRAGACDRCGASVDSLYRVREARCGPCRRIPADATEPAPEPEVGWSERVTAWVGALATRLGRT